MAGGSAGDELQAGVSVGLHKGARHPQILHLHVSVCACVCVYERVCACVFVFVCV